MTEPTPQSGPSDAAASSHEASASKVVEASTVTVTTRSTIEEYSTRRKKPWWLPLAAVATVPLALIPVRARNGSDIAATADSTVAATASDSTTPAQADTTAAPETAAPDTAGDVDETTPIVETTAAVADSTAAAVPATDAATTTVAEAPASRAIPGVVGQEASLSKFAAALTAAGMTDELNGPGPFAVFAPTDAAFDALPAGALEALLKPEHVAELTAVLGRHVADSPSATERLSDGTHDTHGNQTVEVGATATLIDAAHVVSVSPASNGLVYVIDQVLVPEGFSWESLTNSGSESAPASDDALTVYFADSSADLDDEAKAKLDAAVEKISALPAGTAVDIVGHASVRGTPGKNLTLSRARARIVRDYLIRGLGDKANDVTFNVSAKGETEPDVDEAKSRRVTIHLG